MEIIKFKLFESSKEEKPELGFKYSLYDVKEALYYLTDIGFKVEDIKSFYINDSGNYINSDVMFIEATKSVYSIKLKKQVKSKNGFSIIGKGNEIYTKDIDGLLEMVEELSAFCDKFDNTYHSINYKDNDIEINIIISNEISGEVKELEKKSMIDERSKSELSDRVWRFFRKFSDDRVGITPTFNKVQKDNLGNSFQFYYGSLKQGTIIKFFNATGVSKSVINTNFKRIENIVSDSGWNIPRAFHTVEFRKVTEEDLKKIKTDLSLDELKQKFLGLDAVILTLDYDKWFSTVKKDWIENFDERIKRRGRYW
jgi:hypothetical protein